MAMDDPGSDTANADICPACDPLKPQFALERALRPRNWEPVPGCFARLQPANRDIRAHHA